jgi:hypothetical protein
VTADQSVARFIPHEKVVVSQQLRATRVRLAELEEPGSVEQQGQTDGRG